MPSKKKNKGGGDGSNNNNDDDLKQEGNVKLQAVLLADAAFGSAVTSREGYQSFGLRPWSSEESTGGSQVLCPINNVPIVEYILDFLSSNGVEQVIVVIGSGGSGNGTALEDYLEAKNLDSGKRSHRPEILVLKDTSLSNAGDALRELYKRNWIRASKQALPFLLVGGDVVADLDLTEAMRAHKDRNAKDAAAVMTVVLKPVRSTTPEGNATTTTRPSIVPRVSDLVVGLVGASSKTIATADAQGKDADASAAAGDHRDFRVLYYDNNNNSGGSGSGTATIPCAFLGQSQTASTGPAACGGLVLRDDLLDTGIAICSPDVLGKLEDEFDYLDLAHDFVANSVAEEEDGLQTRIYAHVLDDPSSSSSERGGGRRGYAARAVDFQTYHAISQDLLRRWAYPAVADHRPPAAWEKERRYELAKVADHSRRGARPLRSLDNDRKATDASAAKPTGIRNNQYQYKEVRNPTKCGRTSVVVGPGMTGSGGSVGEGCFVARCVLGDDVTIGDGVRLVDCHLMDGVTIGDGAALESTVVASKASVGAGAVLGPGCFLGAGCSVGKGVTVKPFSRITLATEDDDDDWGSSDSDDDDDDDDDSSDDDDDDETAAVVGPDGVGKLWTPTLEDLDDDDDEDDDDDDEDGTDDADRLATLLQLQSIGGDPGPYYRRLAENRGKNDDDDDEEDDGFSDPEEDDDDDGDETETPLGGYGGFAAGGSGTFGVDDNDPSSSSAAMAMAMGTGGAPIGRQKGIDVVKEMTEICMEFDDECHPIENLAIELNSFKFSQNATYADCSRAALLSLLRKMEIDPDMKDGRLVSLLTAKLEKFWAAMLRKLCRGVVEEVAVLEALEQAATVDELETSSTTTSTTEEIRAIARKLRSGMAFRFVLQTLHDKEVLSEEAILKWAEAHRSREDDDVDDDDPKRALFRMQSVQDFLEWLEEDDDDDSDDSDSD